MLFAEDFAAQLGDMVFLVDEARGRTVVSEIQLAVGFPLSDKAEREFAVFDARKIKLLVIGVLLVTVGVDLREQEGAGTRLYVLARTGLEDLHAMGSCFLVRAVLVVGHGGLAYDLLDVFELEGGSRPERPISAQTMMVSRLIFFSSVVAGKAVGSKCVFSP
jgi:hypothetical protein